MWQQLSAARLPIERVLYWQVFFSHGFQPHSMSRIPATASLRINGEFDFDVVVKRSSRRRTVEINVRNGRAQLMLPAFVSDREGLAFLRRKADWIRQALK